MRESMSLCEFGKYFKKHPSSRIILDSRNQDWEYSPIRLYLTFTDISIHYAPDKIYLYGGYGDICLQLIKQVHVVETRLHTAITVTCGTLEKDVFKTVKLLLYKG